jgi:hypothetical protein
VRLDYRARVGRLELIDDAGVDAVRPTSSTTKSIPIPAVTSSEPALRLMCSEDPIGAR